MPFIIHVQRTRANSVKIATSAAQRRLVALTRAMSTTATATGTSPKPAPWRAAFLDHITHMPAPELVFSTVRHAPEGSAAPALPRARYCIFRGMWTELPENKHNDAEKNPQAYGSDCPTICTDVRMDKIGDLFSTSAGRAAKPEQSSGSGGGGPVEAVWWAKDAKIQWRVRGDAFVVAPDIEGAEGAPESSGVRTAKSEIGRRMRVLDQSAVANWSWARELTAHFGNVSPGMRGTFKAPPPGMRKGLPFDEAHEKEGEKVEDLHEPTARSHFRVVVIRPFEVEMADLNPESWNRMRYVFDEKTGEWEQYETWA